MKWWVLLLIPFQVFTQDTYNNCENLVKTYQVQYNSGQGGGMTVYENSVSYGRSELVLMEIAG